MTSSSTVTPSTDKKGIETTKGSNSPTETITSTTSTVSSSAIVTPSSTVTSSVPSSTVTTVVPTNTTSGSSSSISNTTSGQSTVTTSAMTTDKKGIETTKGSSTPTGTITSTTSGRETTSTRTSSSTTSSTHRTQTTIHEIIICDYTSQPPTPPTKRPTTSKSCVPSMLGLNISYNSDIPSVVNENKTVVTSNLPSDCMEPSFEWSVDDVSVPSKSAHYLSIDLTLGVVSHVCLKFGSKNTCGFVKYEISSTSLPTTPSTTHVTHTPNIVVEQLKKEFEGIVNGRCNGTNETNLIDGLANIGDKQKLLDAFTKVVQGSLDVSGGGMSTEQVIEQIKQYINNNNDDFAKAMAILMSQLSNVTITDTETLNSILTTLDAALKGSLSYSLVGDGKTLANIFGVIFGTIKGPNVNLMSAKSTAQVDGNLIYLKGDIRSAKYQDYNSPISIENNVRMMAIAQLQAIGLSAQFDMSPFENYTIAGKRQLYKIIGSTNMVVGSGKDEPEDGICLWNCTFDHLGNQFQSVNNMTFTSWATVSSAILILPQSSSTLKSLRLGQIVLSGSIKITALFGDRTQSLTYLGGTIQLMEMNSNYVSFSITGGVFNPPPDVLIEKVIVDPLRIEGVSTDMFVSMDSQSGKGEATMNLTAAKGYTMMMITGFNDISPLPITENATDSIQNAYFRSTNRSLSKTDLEKAFVSGNALLMNGQITTSHTGSTTYNNVSVIYDGTRIIVDIGQKTLIIEDAQWKTTANDVSAVVQIEITGGYFMENGLDHTQTILELSETSRIIIDHGTIIRNATDGYVIMNGKITKIGDEGGDLKISSQSLMNQDAQKEIIKILNNTADFLINHGKEMSDAEIDTVANHLLSIFGSINKAIADALANPLSSDLAKNLANEKANYNDIFNSLPYDSSKIRYVEEYTQEEWAAEATRLVQQQIARQMAAQMERLMGILEDTLVARMTTLPGRVSYEVDGNSMVVTVGRADEVLKGDHICTDWTIVFPAKVEYLNTDRIVNDTIIRVSLICYEINPYAYVDNANVLVSSGALSSSLKTLEGIVIDVNQTTDPISITGRGGGTPTGSSLILTADYTSYQILDVHTFHTVQWNSSVVIEFTPTLIIPENTLDTEIWAFVGFQRLPGPHAPDHDFRFLMDKAHKSSLFISSWDLFNRTGLFYVGVGTRSLNDDAHDPKSIVKYPTPDGVDGTWNFVRSINYDYRLRAITKGCFFFVMDEERWDSTGIRTGVYVGDKTVQCLTYHMTYYAGGIYTPEVPTEFTYKYVEQSFPKSCLVFLAVLLVIFHQGVVAWMANRHSKRDLTKGQLHVMADNYPLDTYKYIVAVDTGFKMFATTDSQIHVNIVGQEWQALDRKLEGKEGEGRGMRWGTTERYLMTTEYPLGPLKYLTLWIDTVGLQHRESWFCDRVVVYDLQTKDEFHFNVDNWLGTQNGDGKTERTVGSTEKPCLLREATWPHRLYENIAYIAQYTGGGTMWRLRTTRQVHCISVYMSMFFAIFFNVMVAKGEDFTRLPSFEKNILGFHFCLRDLLFGFFYALFLIPFTVIFPILYSHIKGIEEQKRVWGLKKRAAPTFVEPSCLMPYFVKLLINTAFMCATLLFVLLNVHEGFTLNEDEQNAFARRFYVMLAIWILILEPLKGLILTLFFCALSREHYYINGYEKAFMKIRPRGVYKKAPKFDVDDEENAAKLASSKSERSEDQRMRDEQLFTTARQVITFLVSIFILLGLTYFCRDRFGFYYQQEVTNLFSINGNPYDGKSFQGIQTIDQFYNWTVTKLVPALRVSWYDDQPAWDMRGFMNDKASRSMGYGIIRQVRSQSEVGCSIAPQFKKYFDSCEGYSGIRHEDTTEAYTVGWAEATTKNSNFTRQEYTYRSAKELQGSVIIGNMDYYTGGGYAWDIVGTASDLTDQMKRLQKEGWIDENTRAVIIEFSMYNAQVNYFAVIQLVLENPPDGALYPSAWIETVRLMKYVGDDGKFVMAFEALYVLFTVINCIVEICELSRVGFMKYFSTFWHLLGLLVVLCSAFSLYAYGLRYLAMEEAAARFTATNGNTYIRLDSQRDLELYFTWLMAFVVFAVSIQMIRILKFNRRISVLALTLEKSASSMAGFAIVYILINAAFDSALYTLLYSKLLNYRNFLAVTEATTASLLGKFSVTDVLAASTLGSIMFMLFMMTGTIVLVNMFVMIVMYEFESVRNDANNQTNEYEVVQHISSKLLQTVGMFERSDNPCTSFPNHLEHCRAVDVLEKQVTQLILLVDNMRDVDDYDVDEAKKGECDTKMYYPH